MVQAECTFAFLVQNLSHTIDALEHLLDGARLGAVLEIHVRQLMVGDGERFRGTRIEKLAATAAETVNVTLGLPFVRTSPDQLGGARG